jgi:amino acid transporter
MAAVFALWLMTGINVLGLNIGKWVSNVGGIGSVVTTLVLVGLAAAATWTHGLGLRAADFRVSTFDWHFVSAFSVVCYACIGLELASVMGDEIKDPARSLPRAVVVGGIVAGGLYVAATLAVLVAMPAQEIGAVQGILQALGRMAHAMGVAWIVPLIALLLSLAFAGTTSAWLGGSARIPFVAGLDRYLPSTLGTLHPRYATPHVALITQGIVSCVVLLMGFVGSTVQEAYRVLLLLAVVLQLTPFGYVFAALIKIASAPDFQRVRYSRTTLLVAGAVGFAITATGICLAFVPTSKGDSAGVYEAKMIVGTLFILGLGAVLFYLSPRRRAASTRSSRAASES